MVLVLRCIKFVVLAYFRQTLGRAPTARMTRRLNMAFYIQFILSALLLSVVQASVQDNGPQTFEAPQPQYAQRYKEVIMYLTPTQIRNYEAGRGLPSNLPQTPSLQYEQQNEAPAAPSFIYEPEKAPQSIPSYAYEPAKTSQAAPTYIYEQQKPEPEAPINEEEGEIIQSTLDILEANKMQYDHVQQNNPNIEIIRAEEDQNSEIKPIEEPNTENEEPTKFQLSLKQQQEEQKKLEQASKEQEQVAKSYAYIHFFSNQKPESPQRIQIFHPEPHTVNLDDEVNLQKEKNIEIQRDPLLRQKYKLIPYEYIAEENIHQKVREDLIKQGKKQVQQQLFVPAPEQLKSSKEGQTIQKEYQQQYAPQYSIPSHNIEHLSTIFQETQLERETAKIHAENIAKSPAVVIHKDVSIIKRRPVPVTKHVNVPYPAPFYVPVQKPVEVKVLQPYAVPIEIIRHVPVPVVKTETVEVEKPVPYEVEKRVAEIVEKKVYVPVEKPYTVERIVPVEIKKEIPVEIPIHKPEKFTIIKHIWKH